MQQLAALCFLALSLPSLARADSYSWEGHSGRLHVTVWLLGFNEGAGGDGWDERSAREFAAWARRFNAVIPDGAEVAMDRGVNDGTTQLTIRRGSHILERVVMPDGPDFAAALPIVARRFGVAVPPAATVTTLYTIQLFVTRSEQAAVAFAERITEREIVPSFSIFDEMCHPCRHREAHVLEPDQSGLRRVVVGVYDDPIAARAAAAALQRDFGLDGKVRLL